MAKPFIFKDVTCKCAHLLLQEFQNYKSLLDNHQQDNAGSQQKKLPYVQRQRRTPARWWKWSEVAQSCPTLCNPMDCSLPGSMVHGIFQARILEWAAISFSRGSSQPRDQTWVSCIADRRFTIWATREAHTEGLSTQKLRQKLLMMPHPEENAQHFMRTLFFLSQCLCSEVDMGMDFIIDKCTHTAVQHIFII